MAKIKTRLKRNGAYWRKRAEAQEKRVHSDNEQAFRDIEKAFKRALSDMEKDILRWYQRFADNNEISLQEARRLLKSDELQELKWDVQEYIRRGEENAISGEWEKQLENASARWHVSRLEALQIRTRQAMEVAFNAEQVTLEQYLKTRYTESYYRMAYEFQTGIGEGWNMGKIDTRKLDLVVSKPWTADGKEFSARIWEQRDRLVNVLHQELTRNCILGRSPEEAVKVVANEMGKTIQQARCLVMTESAYVHAASQQDCYSDLGVEEFEIVATLDSHTSTICQNMDGKHFPASQYEVGVTVPPFHPNCRSVTCPYFDDEFTVGETRAAKSKDGKTVQVPANLTYPKWKELFC